jgi:hypothetical protein
MPFTPLEFAHKTFSKIFLRSGGNGHLLSTYTGEDINDHRKPTDKKMSVLTARGACNIPMPFIGISFHCFPTVSANAPKRNQLLASISVY